MSKRKKYSNNKHPLHAQPGTLIPLKPNLQMLAGVALIVLAAFLAYLQSINGGFVLDDNLLLTKNDLILNPGGLHKLWCTTESVDYWPATNTSFWIEWRLWGMNSTGYHVTNLMLHIVESLLIWVILRKLSIPGAFLAALLFTVHPVNVETVAWIASRKNIMAMLFFLLSIFWYMNFDELARRPTFGRCPLAAKQFTAHRPSSTAHFFIWYWLSLAAFMLAMLGKGSAAVLPALVLGIIWWRRKLTKQDFLRTAPFFIIAAALTGVNIWFQRSDVGEIIRNAGFLERLLGAGGVTWFYLYKALLPFDLAFIYPQWHIEAGAPMWWLPLLAALAVTAVLWRYRKGWSRPLLFAWGFFCVSLLPVLGFTGVGFMKYSLVADHYQHIAIIGVIALAAAGWSFWHEQERNNAQWLITAVAVTALGLLAFLTWRQCGIYHDATILYRVTLQKNPGSWLAHNNLGLIMADAGRPQEAVEHFREALLLNPDYIEAHLNLGAALANAGQQQEAIEHFRHALRLNPDYTEAYNNLGNALAKAGRPQEAIEQYEQALRLKPDYANVHNNLGAALVDAGRMQEAIEQYEQALRLNPNYANAHKNLGDALVNTGRLQEAIEHYQQALRLKPGYANIYYNLALLYAGTHQSSNAIDAAQKGLALARSQGQEAQAKKFEDWLKAYRVNVQNVPNVSPSSESNLPAH
jgi:protein O-mannosyl-transferase